MKNLLIIIGAVLLVGCGEPSAPTVINEDLVIVNKKNIQIRNNIVYLPNQTKPFTGIFEDSEGRSRIQRFTVADGKVTMRQSYYKNGQVWDERHISPDGSLTGPHKTWHENGQLASDGYYKEGEVDGHNKRWYENGQLKAEAYFKDGSPSGLIKEWHENGQLKRRAQYKDGEIQAGAEEWDENGFLKASEGK